MMKLMMMVSMVVMTAQFANAADAKTIAACLRIESESGLCEKHQYDVNKVSAERRCYVMVHGYEGGFLDYLEDFHRSNYPEKKDFCVENETWLFSLADKLNAAMKSCTEKIKNVVVIKKVMLPSFYPESEEVTYKPFQNIDIDYSRYSGGIDVETEICKPDKFIDTVINIGWPSIMKNSKKYLSEATAEISERANIAVPAARDCLNHIMNDKQKLFFNLYGLSEKGYYGERFQFCKSVTSNFRKPYSPDYLNCMEDLIIGGYNRQEAKEACAKSNHKSLE